MNGMWGYKITDQDYKSTKTLIHYLVKSAGKNANLLMNIGPQPNGELPAVALQRLTEMGEWMTVKRYMVRERASWLLTTGAFPPRRATDSLCMC